MSDDSGYLPDSFDRLRGLLIGLTGVTNTKPTTIIVTMPLLGTSETYIVETFRQREEKADDDERTTPARDTIFLQAITRDRNIRLAIPAQVADAIARQRDALTAKARKAGAKRAVATRTARGIKPGFLKRK